MNVRDNLTGILVAGCVAAIVGFALYLNFAPCLSVNWIRGIGSGNGWTRDEAWCVAPNNGRRPLINWFRVRRKGEKPVLLKAARPVQFGYGWSTEKYYYTLVIAELNSHQGMSTYHFIFRVDPRGKVEVCGEIENFIWLDDVVELGKDGETEWARLDTTDREGPLPHGQLKIRFNSCVDGSDLVSFSGRLRSRLHKYGLCADPVQHFIGAVPKITVDDILFDDEAVVLSPAKTPSAGFGEPKPPNESPGSPK